MFPSLICLQEYQKNIQLVLMVTYTTYNVLSIFILSKSNYEEELYKNIGSIMHMLLTRLTHTFFKSKNGTGDV